GSLLAAARRGRARPPGARSDFKQRRALFTKAQRTRAARLAVEAAVAEYLGVVFGEVARPPGPECLLVRYRRQGQPPMQLLAQLVKIEKGEDRGGWAPIYVPRAAPREAARDPRPPPPRLP